MPRLSNENLRTRLASRIAYGNATADIPNVKGTYHCGGSVWFLLEDGRALKVTVTIEERTD